MKSFQFLLYPMALLMLICSCEKIDPNAVEIQLNYSWGTDPGENQENPEITLSGVPDATKFLVVQLKDLDVSFADHGEAEKIPYNGNTVIPKGILKNYVAPSPPRHEGYKGNLYEFTVKALDENGMVIGIGKKAERCCPGNPK